MEASLTCAVCLGVFREPVTLPLCSHNFCKRCVAECAEPQSRLFPHAASVAVPCPLCRKVSAIHGGLSALPVNTTLAELARLLLAPTPAKEEGRPRGAESPLPGHCPDHPEHRLELFCKNCAQACCGKCVSAAHQGIFHSVNLLDMIYQEEKLMFFSSLKKLREMYEKVTKEGPDDDREIKDRLQKTTDMVNSTFDEAQKALDLKRQHLLDFIKQQESTAIKRQEVWKRTNDHHKITLEHLLKDSEALVDEVEPKCFLKGSCSLNQRMKSYLDLIELSASHCHDTPKAELNHLDLKPVLDAITDLKITPNVSPDPLPKGNGGLSFKTLTRTWGNQHAPTQKYSPVQNQELCYLQGQLQKLTIRLLSITEMPEYRHLSFEELRMKYYEDSAIQENDRVPFPQQDAAADQDSPYSGTIDITKIKSSKIKRLGFGGGVSNFKPKPERFPKSATKMEPEQKNGALPSVFKLPNAVEVDGRASTSCLRGAIGGVPTGKGDKENKVMKETSSSGFAPAFCFGRTDTTAGSKPCKTERVWKKPKTGALPTTSITFLSNLASTSKPVFTFSSIGHSKESKDASPFSNPFTQQESKVQENEVPEDPAAQATCSEEFFDANSDTEETEETKMSSNAG